MKRKELNLALMAVVVLVGLFVYSQNCYAVKACYYQYTSQTCDDTGCSGTSSTTCTGTGDNSGVKACVYFYNCKPNSDCECCGGEGTESLKRMTSWSCVWGTILPGGSSCMWGSKVDWYLDEDKCDCTD